MENPKLCHDKSKHSCMLNMFCFPSLCCQCLGVNKDPSRVSVESVIEAGSSQLGVWSLCIAATAELLLLSSIHKGLIIKTFSLINKCSSPCPDELLEGMFFSERNVISLYSALSWKTSVKRCAPSTSCTSAPQCLEKWWCSRVPWGFYHLDLSSVCLQVSQTTTWTRSSISGKLRD